MVLSRSGRHSTYMRSNTEEERGRKFSSKMPRTMSNLPDFLRCPFLYVHLCFYTKSGWRYWWRWCVRRPPKSRAVFIGGRISAVQYSWRGLYRSIIIDSLQLSCTYSAGGASPRATRRLTGPSNSGPWPRTTSAALSSTFTPTWPAIIRQEKCVDQ